MEQEQVTEHAEKNKPDLRTIITRTIYILGSILLFVFALDLMVSSLQQLGGVVTGAIIRATSNPFTALFIGLLITALIQSSSTSTALVVALVASNMITPASAIPIIMGANIGTTITSTIVSLGFINKKKEFRRAVSAGTYHDLLNILTVIILFPLEYSYGFLSTLSQSLAAYVEPLSESGENTLIPGFALFGPVVQPIINQVGNGVITAILAFILLFVSILIFRKLISELLLSASPEKLSRFFFRSQFKGFAWGLLATAAIRSSTITTSVVVPIVAKKIAPLQKVAPFILGANIGTTITAFIAALLNAGSTSAISIAIVHILFNLLGALIFFPLPIMRKIPIFLSQQLGRLTNKFRLSGLLYILLVFFIIPFGLIYLSQINIREISATYITTDNFDKKTAHVTVSRISQNRGAGEWLTYLDTADVPNRSPDRIQAVYRRDRFLVIDNETYLFNDPAFCWNGENELGRFRMCIDQIIPQFRLASGQVIDSVSIFTQKFIDQPDSLEYITYLNLEKALLVKRIVRTRDSEEDLVIISYTEK